MRINVLKRDDYRCLWCGRGRVDGVNLDVDHIIAEAWGGMTTEDNLGTLCSHCNRAKGADYFGSYLLKTIFKVKNLESWFEDKFVGHNMLKRDGDSYTFKIMFYKNQNGVFLPQIIEEEYFINGMLLVTQDNPDKDIRIAEIKKEALLKFKDRIKNYLFENKGFLEESEGKLIFRDRK